MQENMYFDFLKLQLLFEILSLKFKISILLDKKLLHFEFDI